MAALEALPGPALVVLLALAGVAGWCACRVRDRMTFHFDDARGLASRGGRLAWHGVKRLVVAALVVCGLLFVLGIAYTSTH